MSDHDLPGLAELTLADYVLIQRDVLAEYIRDRVHTAVLAVRAEFEAEPLMTVQQVAERLAVSEQTVAKLVATGQLRATRVQNMLRFRRADVEAYLRRAEPAIELSARRRATAGREQVFRLLDEAISSERNGNGAD